MIDRPLVSLALILLPIIVLLGMEIVSKRFHVQPELTRKAAHVIIGIIAVLGFLEGPLWLYAVSVSALTGIVFVSLRKRLLSSLHGVKRPTFGELFLPLGLLAPLPFTLDAPEIYITSILVMTLADSFAGLVGFYTKQRTKSIRGSVVFLGVAFGIILLAAGIPWTQALLVAVIATGVERFSNYGSDNLTIPLVVTAVLLLL